jgi:serine/threonine protein phosphatase PrpC
MSNINIAQATLRGNRKINQDRFISIEGEGSILLGLADGMGGHPKGEVAAQILIDTCKSFFHRTDKPIHSPREFLHRLLQKAHENVTAFGLEHDPPIKPRTTAVVALIQEGVARWAHAGDSRLYLFRNGKTLQRTADHSYVQHLEDHGMISHDKMMTHPQRNYVTRCLGGNITSPEITVSKAARLKEGDAIMLCSDGLWSKTDEIQMAKAFCSNTPLAQTLEDAVNNAAETAAPSSDNVTAIALRWHMEQPKVAKPVQPQKEQQKDPAQDDVTQALDELKSAIESFENEKK